MPRSTGHRSSLNSQSSRSSVKLSRRQLLAGAGAAAFLLEHNGLQAQGRRGRTVVFAHTIVVNVDAVHHDVALAVGGDKIAGIGSTVDILKSYPNGEG